MKLPKRAVPGRLLAAMFIVALTAVLAACGPDTQENSSTALDGDNTTQIAGVIIPQESVGTRVNPAEVAAARARQPHQYDEARPLSLFDFRTNLNPASNR